MIALGGAFLGADAAPLAVFRSISIGDAGFDDPFRAVEPAEVAGRLVLDGGDAFCRSMTGRTLRQSPVFPASPTAGTHGGDVVVFLFFHHGSPCSSGIPFLAGNGLLVGGPHCRKIFENRFP